MSPKLPLLGLAAGLLAAAVPAALSQTAPAPMPMDGHAHGVMHQPPAVPAPGATPTMPGQDAFGAIQEIVRILEADSSTDWSKVNLAALREHLIDINEVTLKAAAAQHPVEGGLEVAVTGSGRTLEAIRRMVPAHARELDGLHGWRAKAEPLEDGVRLTVTSADPKEVAHIRG